MVLDNQAVYKVARHALHREVSDMEMRGEAAQNTADKRLKSRWMPSHHDITRAQDERKRLDRKMKNLADPSLTP